MTLVIKNLTKKFSETVVVNDVSFTIPPGEVVTLLGPSGCGKTTVLRMVAGLEDPTSGSIGLDDTDITSKPPYARGMGMVFQSYALWPHKTVFQNVSFPLEVRKQSRSDTLSRVADTLQLVGLESLQARYPHELSGGQQQRVALARALIMKPKLLLLDEPLSNLDAKLREQMRRELRGLQQKLGLTMLYVTHDRLEAQELSDQMAILDQGRLIQMGRYNDISRNPANEFVAHFLT